MRLLDFFYLCRRYWKDFLNQSPNLANYVGNFVLLESVVIFYKGTEISESANYYVILILPNIILNTFMYNPFAIYNYVNGFN